MAEVHMCYNNPDQPCPSNCPLHVEDPDNLIEQEAIEYFYEMYGTYADISKADPDEVAMLELEAALDLCLVENP